MDRFWVFAMLMLSACGGQPLAEEDDAEETGETGDPWADHHDLWSIEHFEVDMLFVIDDSASMATMQAKLVELASYLDSLEHGGGCTSGAPPHTTYSYRIAFTTTDNGNPWCTSSADAGDFIRTPCFERLDDFVDGDIDVRDEACLAQCPLDVDLELLPTKVEGDPVPRVRPWIDGADGVSNLPIGTSVQEAAACLLPQGIAGCEFESPLESMRMALEGASTLGHPNFGFLRDNADLVVYIVSDSFDCSLAPGGEAIFDPEGEKAFWSNQNAESPTPAVCWNAGMQCIDNPDGWDTCEPANKGASGEAVEADAAVLHPVERYLDFLHALEQDKQAHGAHVTVAVAAGFTDHGDTHYENSPDPEWEEQYGVGPSCTAPPPPGQQSVVEVPPAARIFEVVKEFGYGISMCDSDIGPLLSEPFEHTCQGWAPPCYPNCVLDSDPETPVLDPECEVAMHVPGEDSTLLPECLRGQDGAYIIDSETQDYVVPEGNEFCFVLDVEDFDGCSDHGLNLQIRVARASSEWVHSGTRFSASCVESPEPEVDCP
jgi:hypothetical protein